jgi:hypothetical protein
LLNYDGAESGGDIIFITGVKEKSHRNRHHGDCGGDRNAATLSPLAVDHVRPNTLRVFREVAAATSSADSFRRSAIAVPTVATLAGWFGLPRNGTGAR